jgi:hypothetical protein
MLDEDLEIIDLTTALARAPTRPHRSQRRRRSTSSTATSSMRSEPHCRLSTVSSAHNVVAHYVLAISTHHVVAHYVLAISTQGSHISKRYYKSRIPKSSNTRGCNHGPTQPPHIDVQKQIGHKYPGPGAQGQPTQRRDCPNDCRDSCTSHPRAGRSAHRCARRRVSTTPVTDGCTPHWQTDHCDTTLNTRLFA